MFADHSTWGLLPLTVGLTLFVLRGSVEEDGPIQVDPAVQVRRRYGDLEGVALFISTSVGFTGMLYTNILLEWERSMHFLYHLLCPVLWTVLKA